MKAFISHSSNDKDFVQRLAADLRMREGIDVWLDKWDILPGDKIPGRIEEAISDAEAFILVLSPDSVTSPWVESERQAWLALQIEEERRAKEDSRPPNRRLIPVLYRHCNKPAFLQPIHHVTITDQHYDEGFSKLVQALLAHKRSLEASRLPPVDTKLSRRKYAFSLLKILLPSEFDEVRFHYQMPSAHIPTNVAQVQRAITLIEYALQREGAGLQELLDTIFEVAPRLNTPQ
jgi:hypothetical protein